MESQERIIDIKNILSTGYFESEGCKYIKQTNTIDCNFHYS